MGIRITPREIMVEFEFQKFLIGISSVCSVHWRNTARWLYIYIYIIYTQDRLPIFNVSIFGNNIGGGGDVR